jgi:hypothetical protein
MIKRRDFIAGLSSAAAWPVAARAQQPAMPVVGVLTDILSADDDNKQKLPVPFLQGLRETGYVEWLPPSLRGSPAHCLTQPGPRHRGRLSRWPSPEAFPSGIQLLADFLEIPLSKFR